MKKTKFIQDAKQNPARFYRYPTDVIRDRRLTDADRKDIIAAWEREMQDEQHAAEDGSEWEERLDQLRRAREILERDRPSGLTDSP